MPNDITADAGEQVEQAAPESTDDGFKAPASQEELDRIIQKRLDRERAKFQDYEEVKSSAQKLAEAEAAARDQIAALKRDLEVAQSSAVKFEVAQAKGVPADLLAGSTREELESAADRIIAFRDEHARQGNYVPSEGRSTNTDRGGDLREFTRNLFATPAD